MGYFAVFRHIPNHHHPNPEKTINMDKTDLIGSSIRYIIYSEMKRKLTTILLSEINENDEVNYGTSIISEVYREINGMRFTDLITENIKQKYEALI